MHLCNATARSRALMLGIAIATGLSACTGSLMNPDAPGGLRSASTPGSSSGLNGGQPGSPTDPSATYIPANIRKLSNPEYDNSVKELLGLDALATTAFASDVRNSFYTSSVAQVVDETRGDQLRAKAEELSAKAVSQSLSKILPCPATQGDACARKFVETFATKAFRRPVDKEEVDDLLAVFNTAKTGGTFNEGVQSVVAAVLQSPSFLYVPQIGEAGANGLKLGAYETASSISYFVLGAPPDADLLAAAASNELQTGAERAAHFDRLINDDPRAKTQLVRFVKEWLGIDQLYASSPVAEGVNFDTLRPHLEGETAAFVEEVLFRGDALLNTLLAADFTMANSTLAAHYGLTHSGSAAAYVRSELGTSKRRGLLTQGAFLVSHASRDHSSPVKRGVTVMRHLLCRNISFPTGDLAKAAMMIPVATANQTTRERFQAHSSNPSCAACHTQIDPLGFGFENFDQVGRFRATEAGKPVDPSGELTGTDIDGAFADAASLIDKLSQSETVHRCFARNVFRFGAGIYSEDAEASFLTVWSAVPANEQNNVLSILRAFVASDLFITRSAE